LFVAGDAQAHVYQILGVIGLPSNSQAEALEQLEVFAEGGDR